MRCLSKHEGYLMKVQCLFLMPLFQMAEHVKINDFLGTLEYMSQKMEGDFVT